MGLRGDGFMATDVRGTALDVLANTEYLVVGGSNQITLYIVGASSANAFTKIRSNRSLVRLLKFNPIFGTVNFASVSGQFIDIYTLGQNAQITQLASFAAQNRKVSDFCWCPLDEQLMVSCAEQDTVCCWDLRDDLRQPCMQLSAAFGAGQSKFAPHLNNFLLTTHGTYVRLWDLRHTSQPVVQFCAHKSRILCLDWHPHHREPNSFFTSANDSRLKLWTITGQNAPSFVSTTSFSAWRLVFSYEGEELAALALPPINALALYSNYGLDNARLLRGVERDTLTDAAWQKSTTALKSTTKFLYTLSAVKQQLCRHAIAYELSHDFRDEMSTPTTQTKEDEESDRLVAVAAEQHHQQQQIHSAGNLELHQQSFDESATTSNNDENERQKLDILFGAEYEHPPSFEQQTSGAFELKDEQKHQQSSFPTHQHCSPPVGGEAIVSSTSASVGMMKSHHSIPSFLGGSVTPQSPICSEWQRWIRAPNIAGGDLLNELEALRKHTTEGLYTTEVNFSRAAIAFSYMHYNKHRKINFEMRFHREFIDNGLVFVEILQAEAPFNGAKASLLLTLLQQECDEQLKVRSEQTILCRVLKQMPKIIELVKVFGSSTTPAPTAAIDVPDVSKASSQSGSTGDEQQLLASLAEAVSAAEEAIGAETKNKLEANHKPLKALPCSYTPSPFDNRVPAPRNCGARFNRSGYLVAFGPMNRISFGTSDVRSNKDFIENINELKAAEESIPRLVPQPIPIRGALKRVSGTARSPQSESRVHPRSLAEYCIFVNPTPPASMRQTSSTWAGPFQCSPPIRGFNISAIASAQQFGSTHLPAPWPKFSVAESLLQLSASAENHKEQHHQQEGGGGGGIEFRAVPRRQLQKPQNNSLSPPSLLQKHFSSIDGGGVGAKSEAEGEEELVEEQLQQRSHQHLFVKSQPRPILGASRIFGTSPTSCSSPATSGFRSITHQNIAYTVRHRGNSMSIALSPSALPTATITAPKTASTTLLLEQRPLTTTASSSAVFLSKQQQEIVEHLCSGHAAVMPERIYNTTVVVYDTATLLPISPVLARSYKLLGDNPSEICYHNLEQSQKHGGREDLISTWTLLAQIIGSAQVQHLERRRRSSHSSPFFARLFKLNSSIKIARALSSVECMEIPWSSHPLGKEFVCRLLEHYTSNCDIQSTAAIICMFNILKKSVIASSDRRKTQLLIEQRQHSGSTVGPQSSNSSAASPNRPPQQQQVQSSASDHSIKPNTSKTLTTTASISSSSSPSTNSSSAAVTRTIFAVPPLGGGTAATAVNNIVLPLLADHCPAVPQPISRKTSTPIGPPLSLSIPRLPATTVELLGTSRGRVFSEHRTVVNASNAAVVERLSPAPEYLSSVAPKTTYSLPSVSRSDRAASEALLLDPSLENRFNEVKRLYADILYRWRMYKKCAEVMKHCTRVEDEEDPVGVIRALVWCPFCGHQKTDLSRCSKCRQSPLIICSICEQPCRGVVTTCVTCSHGGHPAHLAPWFDSQSQCPLGCGCECKF